MAVMDELDWLDYREEEELYLTLFQGHVRTLQPFHVTLDGPII